MIKLFLQGHMCKFSKRLAEKIQQKSALGKSYIKYEYKLLCQFARDVAHRMPYTSVLSICTTSLQGHTKVRIFTGCLFCVGAYYLDVSVLVHPPIVTCNL